MNRERTTFLLHIPCWLHFYLGSFSYTSHAGFILKSGEFLWHIPFWTSFSCGEFLLHIPCWLHFYLRSFSDTSHAGFIFIWGVSLTHPLLISFLSGEFLLHIPCWLYLYLARQLHSTDETLAWRDPADLEPVYDLFTMIVKSSRQSRCHLSPTQELRACILRRQSSSARKNRTRKKKKHDTRRMKNPWEK